MSITQESLQQLHSNILDYLTKRSRIMSCQKLHSWNEFTDQYNDQYADISREDLRREFIQTILPKVFTYNLNAIQRRKIEIFASHNGFTSTEHGFKEVPPTDHLPTEGIHFSTSKIDAQEHGLACVVGEYTKIPTPDEKIKTWVSAVSSTDDELALNRLLSNEEIISRLNESHEEFKNTGNYPPNLTATIAKKIIDQRNECQRLSSHMDCVQDE